MHIKLAVKRKLEQSFGYGFEGCDIFLLDILENYNCMFFYSVLNDLDLPCNICELTKSHRVPYSPSSNKSSKPLQLYIFMYRNQQKFLLFLKLVIILHLLMNVQG